MTPEARHVLRHAVFPQLSASGIAALQEALAADSPDLLTGATTDPPPLHKFALEPVQRCCPIGYAILQGSFEGEATVGQIEEKFAELAFRADGLAGHDCSMRHLILYIDGQPWEEVRRQLHLECLLALSVRGFDLPAA